MRLIAAVAFIIATTPAFAGTCWYADQSGDRITFLDNGENELIIQRKDGQTETCTYGVADSGVDTIWCDAESKTQSGYAKDGDTLHAFEQIWTRRDDCPDADM
jgi:hypothetical protein